MKFLSSSDMVLWTLGEAAPSTVNKANMKRQRVPIAQKVAGQPAASERRPPIWNPITDPVVAPKKKDVGK